MADNRERLFDQLHDLFMSVKADQEAGEYIGPLDAVYLVEQIVDRGRLFIRFDDDTVLQLDGKWLTGRDHARFIDANDFYIEMEQEAFAAELDQEAYTYTEEEDDDDGAPVYDESV